MIARHKQVVVYRLRAIVIVLQAFLIADMLCIVSFILAKSPSTTCTSDLS